MWVASVVWLPFCGKEPISGIFASDDADGEWGPSHVPAHDQSEFTSGLGRELGEEGNAIGSQRIYFPADRFFEDWNASEVSVQSHQYFGQGKNVFAEGVFDPERDSRFKGRPLLSLHPRADRSQMEFNSSSWQIEKRLSRFAKNLNWA